MQFGLGILGVVGVLVFGANMASGLSYKSKVKLDFTVNPEIGIRLSGETADADLLIDNLTPGTSALSNALTVTVRTNAPFGYELSATVGTDDPYSEFGNDSRDLVSGAYSFESIDYDSTTNIGTETALPENQVNPSNGTWGYTLDSGAHYNGLPLYGNSGVVLLSGKNPPSTGEVTTPFRIGARASSTQPVGDYTNVINFMLVAKTQWEAQEIDCPANYICYTPNAPAGEIAGSMNYLANYTADRTSKNGYQSASSNTSVTLVAPNYKREGYGFAGWSTTYDYSGTIYGPNETITAPATQSQKGMTLYAYWIPVSTDYTMQTFTSSVCSSTLSQVTYNSSTGKMEVPSNALIALRDDRDNEIYTVARLADGNCWMIENLRLDDSVGLTTNNTHNPLNNGTTVTLKNDYSLGTISNKLSASTNSWCTNTNAACYDQTKLNTNNTNIGGSGLTPSYNGNNAAVQWYGYGNYYNWYSATGGRGTYASGSGTNVAGDICPKNWKLPYGNNGNSGTNIGNTSGGFYYLANQMSATSSSAANSNKFRMYPNNFVYSGYWNSSSASYRGNNAYYWSSTANGSNSAYNLLLNSSNLYPGTYNNYKRYGFTVRCVAGS